MAKTVSMLTTSGCLRTGAIARVDVTGTFQKQVDYVEKSATSGYIQSEHQYIDTHIIIIIIIIRIRIITCT